MPTAKRLRKVLSYAPHYWSISMEDERYVNGKPSNARWANLRETKSQGRNPPPGK